MENKAPETNSQNADTVSFAISVSDDVFLLWPGLSCFLLLSKKKKVVDQLVRF